MGDEGGIASRILGRHLIIEDEVEENIEKEPSNDDISDIKNIRLPFRKQEENDDNEESDKKLKITSEDKQDVLKIEAIDADNVQKAHLLTAEHIPQQNKKEDSSTLPAPTIVLNEEIDKEQTDSIKLVQNDIPLKFDFQETDVIPQISKDLNEKFQGLDDFQLYELKLQQKDQESDAEVRTPKVEDSGLTQLEKMISDGIKQSTHINDGGVQQMSKNEEINLNFDTKSEEQDDLIVLNFGSTSQDSESTQEEKHQAQESEELNFDNIFIDYHSDGGNFSTQNEAATIEIPILEKDAVVKTEENKGSIEFNADEIPLNHQFNLETEEDSHEQNVLSFSQTLNEEIELDFSNEVDLDIAKEKIDCAGAESEKTIMLFDEEPKNTQESLCSEASLEQPVINIETVQNEEINVQNTEAEDVLKQIDSIDKQPLQIFREEEIIIDDIMVEKLPKVETLNNGVILKEMPTNEDNESEELIKRIEGLGENTASFLEDNIEIISKERMSIYLSDERFDVDKFEKFMSGLLNGEDKQNIYNKLRELETQYLFENFIQLFDIGNFNRKRATIDDKIVANTFDLNDEVLFDIYVTTNNTKSLEFERGEYSIVVSDKVELNIESLREKIIDSKLNTDNVLIAVLAGTIVDENAIAAASRYGIRIIKMDSNLSAVNKNLEDLMNRIVK